MQREQSDWVLRSGIRLYRGLLLRYRQRLRIVVLHDWLGVYRRRLRQPDVRPAVYVEQRVLRANVVLLGDWRWPRRRDSRIRRVHHCAR
jgi:hypothetical protein